MSWKDTAEANDTVLNLMIRKMVKNTDEIPTHLIEPVNNISMISSDIEVFVFIRLYYTHTNFSQSLKANHKANLKPLLHQASGLVIVLGRLYRNDRYPSLWPPPLLTRTVDKFVKYVSRLRCCSY